MEKTCTILTYHLNPDGLGDRFGMVVVVAAALHLCSVILSAQLLQFHRVPAHTQCIKQINCCRIRPFCCVLLFLIQLHCVTTHAHCARHQTNKLLPYKAILLCASASFSASPCYCACARASSYDSTHFGFCLKTVYSSF